MKRRNFPSTLVGVPLAAMSRGALAVPTQHWDRILVLVELNGGNDGLNTVIPFADQTYYRLRPTLAINRDEVLQLSEHTGLHPMLQPLMSVWTNHELAIVEGVGYPDPNRSHFRSIEIWDTGSAPEQYLASGWIARVFNQSPPPADFAADAIVLGRGNLGALSGGGLTNIVMRHPERFKHPANFPTSTELNTTNPALAHLLKVESDLASALEAFTSDPSPTPAWHTPFSGNPVSRQLENAANLIAGNPRVPVIKISHGGFDNHNNQRPTHDRLLGELATGLAEFRSAMRQIGQWDQVLVMTYSEFGRRAGENGSRGTDHGTAAPHFLLGGRVRGGFYAESPSLNRLNDGDLEHSIDFRRLYATVTRSWWGLPSDPVLGEHRPLDCIG